MNHLKKVVTTEKQPIKLWLDDIDAGALEQARNLANLPFVHKHIAVMPDAHLGYGMPIGGVMATSDMIIPNAVGVDIGCGMCAVQTSLQNISREKLKHIMGLVRSTVPLGFKHHKKKQNKSLMPKKCSLLIIMVNLSVSLKQKKNLHQLQLRIGCRPRYF